MGTGHSGFRLPIGGVRWNGRRSDGRRPCMSAGAQGLRPTIRHVMILNAYFAILFWIVFAAARRPLNLPGRLGVLFPYALALPVSPLIVTVLVMLFERRGPAKKWFVALCSRLILPALALWLDLLVVVELAAGQRPLKGGPFLIVFLFNA